jgi:hypothetical protein
MAYRVNGTSIADFSQCRYRWVSRWILNRVPRDVAPALNAGRVLHLIFEDALTGQRTMEQAAVHHLALMRSEEASEKAIKIIEGLAEALPLWKDTFEFEIPVLEVEQPFEIEIPKYPGILWVGRPDRVGICNGRLWHVQTRGLAAGQNFGTYLTLAKRHFHEQLYAVALSRKYPQYKYGGTMFNLIRKLLYRTNVGKKNEATKTAAEMFFQMPMPVNLASPLHKNVMRDAAYHTSQMQGVEREFRSTGNMPAPNDKLNGGFAGNSIDPYFRVMIGEIKLSDDAFFQDRVDMYEGVQDAEGA